MRQIKLLICLTLLLATGLIARAEAPARTALVIGNVDYSWAPLRNPVNDAGAMAEALKNAGFNVIIETNANQAKMVAAVRAFGKALKQQGGVGLFYFSGHGMQIDGENYLIPVGGEYANFDEVKDGSVTALAIVDAMAQSHGDLNIFILDACRNNPIDPKGAKGLSRIDSSARLFVSYATSPGLTALDGTGNNSPYAKYLYQSIDEPNLDIEDTFKRTLKGVYVETEGKQTPWISSTFFGNFVFRPTGGAAAEQEEEEEDTAQSEDAPESLDLAGVYRVEGTNPSGNKYRGMVALAQNDDEFEFTWWIGKDTFTGPGHFAGPMLVVDWGDKTPVIYSLGEDGELDGEWADGSATETLTLIANAAADEVELAEGTYSVEGKNADGKAYEGTVEIAKKGKRYRLSWEVGDQAYEGTGTLAGNLLTVDWGAATPVVYALADDGSLTGLWDGGYGEETLTPEE